MVGQTVGPIGTELDIQIQLDPGIVLGKCRSRSERCRRKNGGAVDAESDRDGANTVGMSIEAL